MFAAFFDRVRAAGKAADKQPGYPRIKPYQRFSQVLFIAGDGAKWRPSGFGRWAYVTFQAVGAVKVREHRPVPGTVKALQLTREKIVICPVHGMIDADVNGARNIASRAGLGSGQAPTAA